jgi:Leucine-rich repeat (LRR) protein
MAAVSEDLLRAVATHPGLTRLEIDHTDVSSADPNLLAKTVCKLEEVAMQYNCSLTELQLEAVFKAINDTSKLRILSMNSNNISSVNRAILANAVRFLEQVDFSFAELRPEQVRTVFTTISRDSNLKRLTLDCNDVSSVDPAVMAQAVNRLEDATLRFTGLTCQQVEAVLRGVQGDSRLKTLVIAVNDLSLVDAGLMARSINMIEHVDIYSTDLTRQQVEAILTQSLVGTSLKLLKIDDRTTMQMDTELMVRARQAIGILDTWTPLVD